MRHDIFIQLTWRVMHYFVWRDSFTRVPCHNILQHIATHCNTLQHTATLSKRHRVLQTLGHPWSRRSDWVRACVRACVCVDVYVCVLVCTCVLCTCVCACVCEWVLLEICTFAGLIMWHSAWSRKCVCACVRMSSCKSKAKCASAYVGMSVWMCLYIWMCLSRLNVYEGVFLSVNVSVWMCVKVYFSLCEHVCVNVYEGALV